MSLIACLLACTKVETALAQSTGIDDETVQAVVRIKGCDMRGCNRGLGSGVFIHSSGLVLTARHVTQNDPLDPNSGFLDDFVIEVTDDVMFAPTARYRANLAATSNAETDLALLWIYWDEVGRRTIPPGTLTDLPYLTTGDAAPMQLGEPLHILGYPLAGGDSINYTAAGFGGFQDNGAILKVSTALSAGNSGGPALVVRDGHFQIAGVVIRRSTLGDISQIRNINQLQNLDWSPNALRVWTGPTQIESDGDQLQLRTTVHAVDFAQRPLRWLAYGFDAKTGRPWPSSNPGLTARSGQLVLTHELLVDKSIVTGQPIHFRVPLVDVGAAPSQLRFQTILWSPQTRKALWNKNRSLAIAAVDRIAQVSAAAAADQAPANPSTATATVAPLPPTSTSTPSNTPTVPPRAAATSTPIATPTPTAIPTATLVPFTSTLTATPRPSNTPIVIPTATPTSALPAVYDPALSFNISSLVELAPSSLSD